MSRYVEFEQWVPVPIEKVFRFFANPRNLPRIMPPETGVKLAALNLVPPTTNDREAATIPELEPLAGVGSEIVTSFLVFPFLPFRARWIAVITEFEWNHHFADVQKRGPFKRFQHRHQFTAETRAGVHGTTVRDVIAYDVGFGVLGDLAQQLFIGRKLQSTFAYRQQKLEKLLME